MRPLHLRLIADPDAVPGLAPLVEELTHAGHFVSTSDADKVPLGISGTPDLVITDNIVAADSVSLDAMEARHIASVLHATGGNKRQTALLLGVARSTLLAKIRRYRL